MPDRFLTHRSRSRASLAMRSPDPGRYLAVDDGQEIVMIALRPGMTRIGRSATADIAFDDGGLSRRHAVVMTRTDGSAEVLDDGSLNGTFVNGERVRRQVLAHGDVLTVGRRRLRYLEVRLRRQASEHTEELTAADGAATNAAAAA
jgi:pSer/pThr/pTyr-binding forkhead associated (FHA) protein